MCVLIGVTAPIEPDRTVCLSANQSQWFLRKLKDIHRSWCFPLVKWDQPTTHYVHCFNASSCTCCFIRTHTERDRNMLLLSVCDRLRFHFHTDGSWKVVQLYWCLLRGSDAALAMLVIDFVSNLLNQQQAAVYCAVGLKVALKVKWYFDLFPSTKRPCQMVIIDTV